MKLVIDIDENTYNDIEKGKVYTSVRDVPQESVLAIRHGKPLDSIFDEIRAEIPKLVCCENEYRQALVKVADVIKCIDKYRAERGGEE
jgi:hypothetical protein